MKQPAPEDLAHIRDQLREEIRDARGTLKDLSYEIKTARDLADSLRKLVSELATTEVREVLEAEVARQLTALGEQTQQQMGKATSKVIAEFDKLRDLLLGQDRVADGREERSIPELLQDPVILARAQRAARHNAAEAPRG
ncbi:hypothetical protein [Streptomyces sp. NPDC057877]|uniref:hypothetical protein n=1 Tax=Streptomyces sp. NPDC057877 TaxID=3346269 RepID=UPI00368DE4C5